MKKTIVTALAACLLGITAAQAQTQIYPHHFRLDEVTLLDGPFKTAMDRNIDLLLQYDVDRLLNPYIRQAGLNNVAGKYYNWQNAHPSFPNWGSPDFNLDGHVGGHYLSAVALAYAACHDATKKAQLKKKVDEMVAVMKDCQNAYQSNTEGLRGFIGGQPMNDGWKRLYASGDRSLRGDGACAVPWYCEHKIMAGLRDAYLYGDNNDALQVFLNLCDWAILVTSKLSDQEMQWMLDTEHGGVNESLLDAYQLSGDRKYLNAAKRFTHQTMLNGMQSLNTSFLDNRHANTQVPKYVGMARIGEQDASATAYTTAAKNFWQDVVTNRTVCIGGNSMYEHFIAAGSSAVYIDNVDGPESCNTNNMLKLTEMLSDETHDAQYADFYEYAMWNHILSTQDPTTGGYVYFTTLRPQGYRIYSTVNESMWCCVGTGMENHSKYGHFVYTRDGKSKVYVNLFTASQLVSDDFVLTQATQFPYEPQTQITVGKTGTYTIAVRHPWWTTADFSIAVNGEVQTLSVTKGKASYAELSRTWSEGDVITVSLPMELRYTQCPNYYDYISFQYGPILLAAQTTARSQAEFEQTGLPYEALQNEYGHEGRMDHAPGSRGLTLGLSSAPLLIGRRADVLSRIAPTAEPLRFSLNVNRGKWKTLSLVPFYTIHHARYSCYFYQQTEQEFEKSDMSWADQQQQQLEGRTLDFVGTGEQQSEAGHQFRSSDNSGKGSYNNEFYRDAQSGGWFEYVLETGGQTDNVSLMLRLTTADRGRVGTVYIDGVELVKLTIPSSVQTAESNGFYNDEYPIPADLLKNSDGTPKQAITFRFEATGTTPIPGLYYLRLLTGYGADHYRFVCSDWTTGDPNRVAADKISANRLRNTLRVTASGQNNVCLKMETAKRIYMVDEAEKFFIIKGIGLSTEDGDSYLWWLNGKNRATSVKPTYTGTAADGATVIAWDITQSGIADNCYGRRWNFAYGQTIFGLTCKRTSCTIQDIGFYTSIEDYLVATSVGTLPSAPQPSVASGVYDLQGRLVAQQPSASLRGLYVVNGKKVMVR